MRFTLLLLALSLMSCVASPISESDRKLIGEGKKSLLATTNRDIVDFMLVIPILLDGFFGEPVSVDIESIDGIKVDEHELHRANVKFAVIPGIRKIVATCTVNKTKDKHGPRFESETHEIDYMFVGGMKYIIFAHDKPLSGCDIYIEPVEMYKDV